MLLPSKFESMNEERLTDIEIRIEYQERTIALLNDVVVSQQNQIEELTKEMTKLKNRLEGQELGFGPANERPPHY